MKKFTLIVTAACTGLLLAISSLAVAQPTKSNSCFTRSDWSTNSAYESYNREVITADFNNDGKQDIATADRSDYTVSILLGDGAGNFADSPYLTINTSYQPYGLVAADFNGDGKVDIATTRNQYGIDVYLGDGVGGFSSAIASGTAWPSTYKLIAGDFNTDGLMDLAVTNSGYGFQVLLGNGNGTFNSGVTNYFGCQMREIVSADLNGDGKLDLAMALQNCNQIQVWNGDGTGSFSQDAVYGTTGGPVSIIAADFNNDSKMDLMATTNTSQRVHYFQNDGTGNFTTTTYNMGFTNPYVTAGDFNSDGKLDFATSDYNNHRIYVVMGDGAGNFDASNGSYFNCVIYTAALVTADFNGDSKSDMVVTGYYDGVTVFLQTVVPIVTANASASTVCAGVDIILTGSGIAPADLNQYSWNPSISNGQPFTWTPGTTQSFYVVGYTNAGCWNTSSPINVTTNSYVNPNLTAGSVTCTPSGSNGTASVAPTGGVGPYTYKWLPGNQTTQNIAGLVTGNYTVTVTDNIACATTETFSIGYSPTVTFNTATVTNAQCNCTGAITLNPTGGTAPYTYNWATSPVQTTQTVTGLCVGNYSVVVLDNGGCINTSSLTIAPSYSYNLTAAVTNAACAGTAPCAGSVTITPTAASTYSFSFLPVGGTFNGAATASVTALCAGNYTVTATDGGCVIVKTFSVGVTPINVTASNIAANCGTGANCNGSSTASVSGGTAPYTYKWSTSPVQTTQTATGLCGGAVLTCTVTDAGNCSNTVVTTIGFKSAIASNYINLDASATCTTSCNGQATAYSTGGVAPFTYLWSPGGQTTMTATGLCPSLNGYTNYTVTVTDTYGCSYKDSVEVNDNGNYPYANNMLSQDASCNAVCNGNSSVVAAGGAGGPYSYLWSNGQTTQTATGLCAQNSFTVTITDKAGCKGTDNVNIDEDPMDLYLSSDDASCNAVCDGEAYENYHNLNSNTGPVTYLWSNGSTSNGITGLCAGSTVTLTITSKEGCKVSATQNIYSDPSLDINIHGWGAGGGRRATCKQSCDAIVASYFDNSTVGPYTYLWSNGQTGQNCSNLCAGSSIGLTVTDANGCKASDTQVLGPDYDDGVKLYINNTVNVMCNGICTGTADVALSSSDFPSFKYQWSNGSTTFMATGLCAGNYTVTVIDALGCRDSAVATINATSPISFSANNTKQASCTLVCNGKATVSNISNAALPYTYKWMPGGQTTATATGLCGGTTYSVTLTDANGCTKMNTVTIGTNAAMSVSTNETDASCLAVCNGMDSVTNVSNANGPVTYMWMPSGGTNKVATGLCSGTYTLTVTDSVGCKSSVNDYISYGSTPTAYASSTDTYCNSACNGTGNVLASGGTSPYNFLWSTGATTASISNLCVGGYGVTVTDANGCKDNDAITVNAGSASMTVSVTSSAPSCNTVCDGTASASTNGGTAPYKYQWSPTGGTAATATGLCGGTYNVVVTDANGCTQSSAVTIAKPAALMTNVTVTNATSCVEGDGTATANTVGGTAPYMFVWTPTGQLTQTAVTLPNGTYAVVVTDARGCTATASGSVTCTSGINELAAENVFVVYPNPTNGHMVVTAVNNAGIQSIMIDNVLGQSVYSVTVGKNVTTQAVDITAQPAGIYMMRIISGDKTYNQKIVKE